MYRINHQTNEIDLEIPDATYADCAGNIIITLPNSTIKFRIVVDATFANETLEAYNLTIVTLKNNEVVDQQTINASIKQNERLEYQVNILSDSKLSVTPVVSQTLQLYLYVGIFIILVVITGIAYAIKVRKRLPTKS